MRRAIPVLTPLVVAMLLASCSSEESVEPASRAEVTPELSSEESSEPVSDPVVVYTVNYPLAYFAERIGGRQVAVSFPAPPGVDPALWSPDAETVAAYQAADLILMNGADYAKWAARVSLPASRMVDTSAALADRRIPLEETVTHTHGPSGEHSHTGWASTLWLDPTLATEMAAATRDALVTARPEAEAELNAGFDALADDLEALDRDLQAAVGELAGREIFVSHPVYQYLTGRYELSSRELDWEAGELPAEADWRRLEALLSEHPATLMLWEAEPLAATRERLESMGLEVVIFDLAANRPESGDWLATMRANLARLPGAS